MLDQPGGRSPAFTLEIISQMRQLFFDGVEIDATFASEADATYALPTLLLSIHPYGLLFLAPMTRGRESCPAEASLLWNLLSSCKGQVRSSRGWCPRSIPWPMGVGEQVWRVLYPKTQQDWASSSLCFTSSLSHWECGLAPSPNTLDAFKLQS